MSNIKDTAYPRLAKELSAKELAAIFTPTKADIAFVEQTAARATVKAVLLLQLKVFHRLGYFEPLAKLPRAVIDHVCRHSALRVPKVAELAKYDASGSRSLHQQKVRDYLGVSRFTENDWTWVDEIARETAATKQELEDIINVLVEELVRRRYELPGFTVLLRAAQAARSTVNDTIFGHVFSQLTDAQRAILDGLTRRVGGVTQWDQLKREPKKPTVREVARFLEHIRWLNTLGRTLPETQSIAVSKRHQMILEAGALDAKDLRAVKPTKRYTLAVLLIQSQLEKATDDIATIFIKTMRSIDTQGQERLREYRLEHSEQIDRLINQFRNVLATLREERPAKDKLRQIEESIGGDPEPWILECDEHAAYAGNNYMPFMLKPYRAKRALLYQCLDVLSLRTSSQDDTLIRALDWLRELRGVRREYLQLGEFPGHPDLKRWLPESWQQWVLDYTDEDAGTRLHRNYLELYIFFEVMRDLQSGDLYAENSNEFDDYREHLVGWDEYGGELANYCDITGIPADGQAFVQELKSTYCLLAKNVDDQFPDNESVRIGSDGIIVDRLEKKLDPAGLGLVERRLQEAMSPINILDLLTEVEGWLHLNRQFGPLSGFESKLDDPLKRFITTLFCYGCNLGPSQTARSVQGLSRKQVAWLNLRYVTEERLDRAITRVINAYQKFALPKYWGSGKHVSADGTKWTVYEQNLLSEYHVRYGGYGGIGYYHVSDMYIAIFSNFIPCGVHEAIYILDGLIKNDSEIQPEFVHGDTHAQSAPVFGLSHLLGIRLMPRIRGIRQLVFYRPDRRVKYKHINSLFTASIDWELIERHYADLMRVAISIKAGRITPSLILRRLGVASRKNRLYFAFRELGRAIRTMFLLNYISDVDLRRVIHQATNKSEQFNGFAKWLNFGNEGIIADNVRHEQRKVIKYNHLVANMVILHNVHTMSKVLKELESNGMQLSEDVMGSLAPYRRDHINRLGHYSLDLSKRMSTMATDIRFSVNSTG